METKAVLRVEFLRFGTSKGEMTKGRYVKYSVLVLVLDYSTLLRRDSVGVTHLSATLQKGGVWGLIFR